MEHWYTVYTKPRQEDVAEANLQRQGFTVYQPRIQSAGLKKGRRRDCIEPLFPRYLFIQADCDATSLAPVRSTRGVSGLVRFSDRVLPVPDEVIVALQGMQDLEAGLIVPASPRFRQNDRVTILEGPFAYMQGVFQSSRGEQRALILLECLGHLNRVCISQNNLTRTS